jgi:ribokinase
MSFSTNRFQTVVVVGSCIMDLIIHADRQPQIGESLIGWGFAMNLGGKGANQATALSRLGSEVSFISCVGQDDFGDKFFVFFKNLGINVDFLFTDSELPTGVGMPIIYPDGSNSIVVDPGASMKLTPELIALAKDRIAKSSALQVHLEVPISAVNSALKVAKEHGLTTFLNPAPVMKLSDSIYELVDVIIPNEVEASFLSGVDIKSFSDASEAARRLQKFGPKVVVITLGRHGALIRIENREELISAFDVKTIDSTGAGDAFCSGLVFARGSGLNWIESIIFSNACGALATTTIGAIRSMPLFRSVLDFLKERGYKFESFDSQH